MNPTPTTAVASVQAATMLAAHLVDHGLPEPVSLTVITRNEHSEVTAQLDSQNVPGIAGNLLAWADTLYLVTAEAWRPPDGDRVHLSIVSTLPGPTGTIELRVFGGANYDPVRFADLQASDHCGVSLGQLHTWAANPPATTATPVLHEHRVP